MLPRPLPAATTARDRAAVDGLLLVGHGTRHSAGVAEFMAVAEMVQLRRPEIAVAPCFLELAEPCIAEGMAMLARRGARRIKVMPLLLFAAGHAKEDVPGAVRQAANAFPQLELSQASPLGCHPAIVELSTLQFEQALATCPVATRSDTLLLMVGRGSRDSEAIGEMATFTHLCRQRSTVASAKTCFLAMSEPSFAAGLTQAAGSPCSNVVVQPHLLFSGELIGEVRQQVAQHASRCPEKTWLITEHLGVHPLLVEAIIDRAGLRRPCFRSSPHDKTPYDGTNFGKLEG